MAYDYVCHDGDRGIGRIYRYHMGGWFWCMSAGGTDIWSQEYWAKKGDVPLFMFRKRLGAPSPGETPRPVLFLVHGSSVTWRIFDLDTPGHGEYSIMNVFARWGFDVWTMDHENYGKSGRTSGNSDIASGAQDLKAAMQVVVRETGRQKAHSWASPPARCGPDFMQRLNLTGWTVWCWQRSPIRALTLRP